jgi:collagen type VI alpha
MGSDPLPGTAKLCYCQTPVSRFVQPAKKSCDLKADIVIVVDESGSVGDTNFALTRLATAKMIGDLMSAGPDIRVGIAKFASEATINTNLTSTLKSAIKDSLEMTYNGGSTNTRGAYNLAAKMLTDGGKPDDYQHIIVFMTDGETSIGDAPDDSFS